MRFFDNKLTVTALSLDILRVLGIVLSEVGRLSLLRQRISESRLLLAIAVKIAWICSLDSAALLRRPTGQGRTR